MNHILIGKRYLFHESEKYNTCMPERFHDKVCKVVAYDGMWNGVDSYVVVFDGSTKTYFAHCDELFLLEVPFKLIEGIKAIKLS